MEKSNLKIKVAAKLKSINAIPAIKNLKFVRNVKKFFLMKRDICMEAMEQQLKNIVKIAIILFQVNFVRSKLKLK